MVSMFIAGRQIAKGELLLLPISAAGWDPQHFTDGFNLNNPGASWHVVGVRDMNADSRADLVSERQRGDCGVGPTNGTHDGFNINPNPNPAGHLD
jgi:hypothetical protein